MKNLLIHNWKGYKKGKNFTTYGFISIFNDDVFAMFDRAAKKVDQLLGYKVQVHEINSSRTD